jgi:1-deoxy-D-xylulose 5-phosphate reductoisomerase
MHYKRALNSCEAINKEDAMDKMIISASGGIIRAEDEGTLAAYAQEHAKETPRMELTREQALAIAQSA